MSNPTLNKTCSVCGLQKPLTAFLELSGTLGTTYGNICADCRMAGKDIVSASKDKEDTRKSTSGNKVDEKFRLKFKKDDLEFRQHQEEEYKQEREKSEKIQATRTEKISKTDKTQKERRQFFENRKLAEKNKAPVSTGETPADVAQREAEFDTADTRVAGKTKTQSAFYLAFKAWLPGNAPIVQASEKAAIKIGSHREKSPEKPQPEQSQEALAEHAKKSRRTPGR